MEESPVVDPGSPFAYRGHAEAAGGRANGGSLAEDGAAIEDIEITFAAVAHVQRHVAADIEQRVAASDGHLAMSGGIEPLYLGEVLGVYIESTDIEAYHRRRLGRRC